MTPQPPPSSSTGMSIAKIAGLFLLGGVALCGVAGTCLFAVLLITGGFGQ